MAKTIIFDLGGVLVHLDWEKVCAPLAALSDRSSGYVRREVINGPLVQSAMRGELDPNQFHQSLSERLAIEISYESFLGIWTGLLSENEEIVPLVERLKDDYPLVLASNTDQIHFTFSKQKFEVLGHLEQHFLSYEIGILKPDPAFFRHVLKSLEAAPGDCVFIDDVAENVESARSLGITAVQFQGNESLQTTLTAIL